MQSLYLLLCLIFVPRWKTMECVVLSTLPINILVNQPPFMQHFTRGDVGEWKLLELYHSPLQLNFCNDRKVREKSKQACFIDLFQGRRVTMKRKLKETTIDVHIIAQGLELSRFLIFLFLKKCCLMWYMFPNLPMNESFLLPID